MGVRWEEFVEFVKTGLREFRDADFGQVRYGDQALATWIGLAFAGLLVLKIVHVAGESSEVFPPPLRPLHRVRAPKGNGGEGDPCRAEVDPGGSVGLPRGGDGGSLLDQY